MRLADLPIDVRCLLVIFPDGSSARMTLAEAQALMADRGPRHGLVVISAESWDGTVARDR